MLQASSKTVGSHGAGGEGGQPLDRRSPQMLRICPPHPLPASVYPHHTNSVQNKEGLLEAGLLQNVREQTREGNVRDYVLWTFQILFLFIVCSSPGWFANRFLSPAKVWGL